MQFTAPQPIYLLYFASMSEDGRVLTYGEKAVGITFNPSGDASVQKVKELAAQMIDTLVNSIVGDNSELRADLYRQAVRDVIAAQMMAVKAITFKD